MPTEPQMKLRKAKEVLDQLRKENPLLPEKPKPSTSFSEDLQKLEKKRKDLEAGYDALCDTYNKNPNEENFKICEQKKLALDAIEEKLENEENTLTLLIQYSKAYEEYENLKRNEVTVLQVAQVITTPAGKDSRSCMPLNFFEIFTNKNSDEIKSFLESNKLSLKDIDNKQTQIISNTAPHLSVLVSPSDIRIINPTSPKDISEIIQMMIKVYLQGTNSKTAISHSVKSDNRQMEIEIIQVLAKTLKSKGDLNNKINGKSVDEILKIKTPSPVVAQVQSENSSPKLNN